MPHKKSESPQAVAVNPLENMTEAELKDRISAESKRLAESIDPLKAELQRRQDEKDREAYSKRDSVNSKISGNARFLVDTFDPPHECGGTDSNLLGADQECPCPRCVLLDAATCDWLDNGYRFILRVVYDALRNPDEKKVPW